jgi:hypothetical protein
MSIDFPRAWQICEASKDEDHDPHCSWVQCGMLCDCDVVMRHPEQLDESTFYGKDGVVISRSAE